MAAKIRLKKVGRKGQPSYRVVVLDGQKPRDAKVVADLGFYDPKTNPPMFEIDSETALKWLLDGAKATSAARSVLSKAGVMAAWDAAKRGEVVAIQPKELKPSTKRKKKEEVVEEAADEAPAEEAVEEPAAEVEEQAEDTSEAEDQETAAEEEAAPEEDAADDTPEGELESEEAVEPKADTGEAADEAAAAEEPEGDAEEEAKEEA
jgi:small subunit ribosomal protein S16